MCVEQFPFGCLLDFSVVSQNSEVSRSAKAWGLQKQISYEPQDVRQIAAYYVENLPVFTRSGTLRIIQSLTKLAKLLPQVSPMIFKPTMLHQMATMSCVVFHTVLFLQNEFENEILSPQEEVDLFQRLCIMCDHPCLNRLHRLLAMQWAQNYTRDCTERAKVHRSILQSHRSRFYPSVFNSVDCQLGKLYMTSLLADTYNDVEGFETSILLGSLGCLHKIVWHTGSGQAARALFKALYSIYTKHKSQSFSKDIQRFVRGLISEFADFIPHSIDFADCVHETASNDKFFVDTLRLLHQQVVMATEEQIYHSYQYYLLIMKKAAGRTEIDQKPALKFLRYLVQNASVINDSGWKLGHGILDICSIIIMCHGTDLFFIELGDLLHEMMSTYNDTDVQDKARFYFGLITGSTDAKVKSVLKTSLRDVEAMNQAIASLLPGSTDKPCLAKIVALNQQIFNWKRLSVSARVNEQLGFTAKLDQETAKNGTAIEQYEQMVNQVDVLLDITCQLELRGDSEFEKAHAVSIQTEPSEVFEPLQNKHIVCLTQMDSHDVHLKLRPKLPFPGPIQCNVTFSCDNKLTYTNPLPSINLEFCDLMIKLPWRPPVDQNLSFLDLWKWVLNRKIDERGGIESVKLFQLSKQRLHDVCERQFAKFLYQKNTGLEETCYAIFLPPRYHLLIKILQKSDDSVIVSMVTDLWTLLPHIDAILVKALS